MSSASDWENGVTVPLDERGGAWSMAEVGERAARAIEAQAWQNKKRVIEERFSDLFFALYGMQLAFDYKEPGLHDRSITITWWDYEDEDMKKILNP